MAHPMNEHRQHHVERTRVKSMLKGYAGGGEAHSDEMQDRALVRKMVKPGALKVEGRKAGGRIDKRARGGKVGKTNINIVVAPQAAKPPDMAPALPPMLPPGPMAGPPMPPPGGPPMMPPGLPPGIGPHKRGGRAYAKGGKVSGAAWKEGLKNGTPVQHSPGKNDTGDILRGRQVTYATGGAIEGSRMGPKMTAGAESGEGRLEKIAIQKRRK